MTLDCRETAYLAAYAQAMPMADHLVRIANYLLHNYGGYVGLEYLFGQAIRRAFDEVIDMPRTKRWSLTQLEKTEKTYIGTKVEILVRYSLSLPKGKRLDLLIDGTEVDIKNTVRSTWTIPREAVGEVCLVIRGDDKASKIYVGLLWAKSEFLTSRPNQDGKVTVNAGDGMPSILWLVHGGRLPPNLFEQMNSVDRAFVLDASVGGSRRLARFFSLTQNIEVSRETVLSIAQQQDAMKRLRSNGGARDLLAKENLTLLSGKYDADDLKSRGLNIARGSFICVAK